MGYVLAVSRYLNITKNKAGKVLRKERLSRGDSVDHLSEEQLDRLLSLGAIRDEDDVPEPVENTEQEHPGQDGGEDSEGQDGAGDGQDEDEGGEGGEPEPDEFEDMDYPSLQQAAKARDLNAGGSADEIRARIRQHEAEQADDDDA